MNGINVSRMVGLAIIAGTLVVAAAQAEVGFIVSAANLQQVFEDQSVALAPTNSIAVLVADTTGGGFVTYVDPYSPLTTGSYLTGDKSGNLIVARWDLNSLGKSGQVLGYATATLGPGLAPGRALALYWFPTRSAAATIVGYSAYGMYTRSTGVDGSDPWVVPSDGSIVQLNFYTTARGGSNPDSAGIANQGVLDPIDPAQFPSTVTPSIDGTNVVITFSTYPGVIYDIQATTDLVSGSWSVIATNFMGGTYTNVGAATAPLRFYRLHEQ
jgi:hypothetical protein